jgi:hypothetical protein
VVLAIVVPLLLPLLVWQLGTGLCVLLAVTIPLLVLLLVYQPGTSLYVLLMVAVPLLLPLLVCEPGMGLCELLTVALLLPGCGGHASVVVALHLSSTLRLLEGCLECYLCNVNDLLCWKLHSAFVIVLNRHPPNCAILRDNLIHIGTISL